MLAEAMSVVSLLLAAVAVVTWLGLLYLGVRRLWHRGETPAWSRWGARGSYRAWGAYNRRIAGMDARPMSDEESGPV